jgi:hypothetical protein
LLPNCTTAGPGIASTSARGGSFPEYPSILSLVPRPL